SLLVRRVIALLLILSAFPAPLHAQRPTPTATHSPASVDEQSGPVLLTGKVTYTNPFFTTGVAAPLIILEDQAGFIDRDPSFVISRASQTLGQITSDFLNSPF